MQASACPLPETSAPALKAADFNQEFSGDDIPPVTEYKLGTDEQGFFAEFLTPLLGADLRRDGSADVTVKKAGITAPEATMEPFGNLFLLISCEWCVLCAWISVDRLLLGSECPQIGGVSVRLSR